jgi:hypothetical protein
MYHDQDVADKAAKYQKLIDCLHVRIADGDLDTLKLLLENISCDYFLVNSANESAAYTAIKFEKLDIYDYLLSK